MPGGNKNINGSDGNTFSSTNQPDRYRGPSLVNRLKAVLKDNPEHIKKIVEKVISKAETGDLKAIEILLDRIDGKAPQEVKNLNYNLNQELTQEEADRLNKAIENDY